jgi:transcriptional regulator with XRE-family HTH domain
MANTIGANIRRAREAKPWTQEQLARSADIDVRTVQRAEKGEPIGAESLQAIAGALDTSMALLQLDPEDVMRQLQEFEKKFKVIPLVRIERAYDLRNCIGVGAMELDYVPLNDEQQQAVAEFEQTLKDLTMIWSDLEPIQRHDALRDLQIHVDELHGLGLVLAAGTETMRLRSEHIDKPFTMECLYLMISTEAEPKLAVARERNRPISFV